MRLNLTNSTQPIPKHLKKLEKGKQGITGLAEIDGCPVVYKISRYMNYLSEHEFLIMKGLNELNAFCPHFCQVHSLSLLPIHPEFREDDQDPFESHPKPLYINVLFMEYIEHSMPLLSLVEAEGIHQNIILASVKQVIMSIIYAQRHKSFTHYDLHSMNILMKECNFDVVHLYVLDKDNVFCVPTYGMVPVIIDYGFSASKDLNEHPMYCSLAYTDAGYMAPEYDPLSDMKIFLVSLAEDFNENEELHDAQFVYLFRNIVKNLFKPLNIDWRSGWDKGRDAPLIDQIFNYIENENETSELLSKFAHFCVDMLQSLITLPLKPVVKSSLKETRRCYSVFTNEFVKIEEEIQNVFYSLYIFRHVMDLTRKYRDTYLNEETREQAVAGYSNDIFHEVAQVAKFCSLKTVHFEKMLCSLIMFQDHLCTQLYYLLERLQRQKMKEYRELSIQNTEHIYATIDMNFQDTYVFNERTIVRIYDNQNKTQEEFCIPLDCIPLLNKTDNVYRGQLLYQIHQLSQKEEFPAPKQKKRIYPKRRKPLQVEVK